MRKNIIVSVLSGVVTAVILFSVTSCVSLYKSDTSSEFDADTQKKIAEMRALIDAYAIEDFDEEAAKEGFYYGYMLGLTEDGYATYYSVEDYKAVADSFTGNFGGIGLQFFNYATAVLEKGLTVYRVLGNSPAEEAGLKIGDIVTSVNGKGLDGMTYDDAYDYVVGFVREGKTLSVAVDRNGEDLSFELTPAEFTQKYVEYKMLEGNVGYVSIYQFGYNSVEEFRTALTDLENAGAKSYIFDVRNDPGGELDSVCSMVDMLVKKGEVIITIEGKNSTETKYAKEDPLVSGKPMAVVVNGSTVSAAEMFTSSLRDLNGATVVGEQTYGKGIGQTTRQLSDGSYIKFTTFRYFTANHVDFNGVGLTPDIEVELSSEKRAKLYELSLEEDDQLYAAWKAVGQ